VPGAGAPDETNWPELYQRIYAAGKKIQVWGGFNVIDTISQQIGCSGCIHNRVIYRHISEEKVIQEKLLEYGIE
jgi:hypothetical protein